MKTRLAIHLWLAGCAGLAGTTEAQTKSTQTRGQTTVAAGAHYDAGGLHRLLFGGSYRALWREPLTVPVLDLDTVAGGLTPTTAGGGLQTKSLRFRGANGFLYGFRSVDKDPASVYPELAGTFVDDIVRDQTSSQHPVGPGLVAPLLKAAGVLHTDPRLVFLPDHPKLGEFREQFAGTLGFFELRAVTEPSAQQFANALEIIDSDELFPMVRASPAHQIDARRFLAARLIDLFLGDWDRHRGQYGWARLSDASIVRWIPIPEDRDHAFVRFDGLLLDLLRAATFSWVTEFGEEYPDMVRLTWKARETDRWFLVKLSKSVWDSVATTVQSQITDNVIDEVIDRLPAAYQDIDGDRLRGALRRRRDGLIRAADEFYSLLARTVDVHATDASETVTVDRHANRDVEIRIAAANDGEPYFHRTFHRDETREIRLFLHGGDDRVIVQGPGKGIILRIIGGGSGYVVDSSRAGGVTLYTTGMDRVGGTTPVRVDRRAYVLPPERTETELPPRDWGHRWRSLLWAGGGPDVGIFLGAGGLTTGFGFRRLPFASSIRLRGGYASGAQTFRAEVAGTFYRLNSRVHTDFLARVSGIEVMRFHGLGNESVLPVASDDYSRVNHKQYTFQTTLTLPVGEAAGLTFGPLVTFSDTEEQPGRVIAALRPYGSGTFGQVGWQTRLEVDTRDTPAAATRGVHLEVGGSVYPSVWDVAGTFGEVHGVASTYLSTGSRPAPRATLALRAGGKTVWGNFPFHEAAFIGDAETVRLGRQNRYAGNTAVWGNAELRLGLARTFIILPGHFGVMALGDVGRVFLDGETSSEWHPAYGGGIWLSFVRPGNVLTVAVVRSEERSGIYIRAGFAY